MTHRFLVLLLVGLPCSGKTTIAQTVARILRLPVLHRDTLQGVSLELGVSREISSALAYELLNDLARDQLAIGNSVIIDSSCSRAAHRRSVMDVATALGAQFYMVECRCDEEVELKQRLAVRQKRSSVWRVDSWEKYRSVLSKYEAYNEPRLIIDSTQPLGSTVRQILYYIGR